MTSAPTRAWISKNNAAKRLGVHPYKIDSLIAQGLLNTTNLNGRMRITRKSLEKLEDDPPPIIRTEVA